ncbi:MAG TPA: carbohydrate ABC transporter permease [Mycobacteriales bacterium]|nr:carbohydrate ABC transporter permease [Mycobacteriales bacterium]
MTQTAERAVATGGGRAAAPARHGPGKRRAGAWLVLLALIVAAALVLLPFLIVTMNALKSPADYSSAGPLAPPHGLHLTALKDFWVRVHFGQKLWNSTLISGSVAICAVLVSLFTAYALGIGRVKGRAWLLVLFIMANTLPQEALIYPLYYLAKQLHMYDTRLAVIIILTAIQSAFGTYLLSSVLTAFPRELLDAAAIDGANSWQTLWRVVVPISRPTLGVLMVFFFIWTWNEFFIPLIFLVSNGNQTVSVALGVLQGQRLMDATMSNASALLGLLPALLFFLLFQRTLTRGITAGAIK